MGGTQGAGEVGTRRGGQGAKRNREAVERGGKAIYTLAIGDDAMPGGER